MKEKEPKLPKRFKKKWLEALRSGDYKQGNDRLFKISKDKEGNKIEEFCCLGVAASLCNFPKFKSAIEDKSLFDEDGSMTEAEILKFKENGLPKILIGSPEISSPNFSSLIGKLTEMNDNGKSFKQIANYIEKNL
jgi:hypothetical protein